MAEFIYDPESEMDEGAKYPNSIVEIDEQLETLWDAIFSDNDKSKIAMYNELAELRNQKAGQRLITVIHNFNQIKQKIMAEKKAAARDILVQAMLKKASARKVAVKPVTTDKAQTKKVTANKVADPATANKVAEPATAKKATAKKAPAKKVIIEDLSADKANRGPSQKSLVAAILAKAPNTKAADIAEQTGIKVTNVRWYMNKIKNEA